MTLPFIKANFKIILTGLFLVVLSNSTFCQFFNDFGAKAGMNRYSETWEKAYSYQNSEGETRSYTIEEEYLSNYSHSFALFGNTQFSESLHLQSELGYQRLSYHIDEEQFHFSGNQIDPRKGFVYDNNGGNSIQTYSANLDYLTLGSNLVFSPLKTAIQPYLTAGFRLQYLIHHREAQFQIIDPEPSDWRSDIAEHRNNMNLVALAGIGIQWKTFFIEAHFAPYYSPTIDKQQAKSSAQFAQISIGASLWDVSKK